jgi:hypothetical protein
MTAGSEVSLVALGGLGEFGRNVLWLSSGGWTLVFPFRTKLFRASIGSRPTSRLSGELRSMPSC